jgi:hypothetical protein
MEAMQVRKLFRRLFVRTGHTAPHPGRETSQEAADDGPRPIIEVLRERGVREAVERYPADAGITTLVFNLGRAARARKTRSARRQREGSQPLDGRDEGGPA